MSGKLPTMSGKKMAITLKYGEVPHYESCARNISIPDRPAVKAKLDELERQGTIVPTDEPSDHQAALVTQRNKNGKVRICLDYTQLNKNIIRPEHPVTTPRDAVVEIDGEADWLVHVPGRHRRIFSGPLGRSQSTAHGLYYTVGQIQVPACSNGPNFFR